jgi:ParB family chromosome partitioning protein
VVRSSGGGRYQVIAGERRVKACYMAHVYKIPAVVRDVTDEKAAEMTIVENLQRQDVNPMDQAQGFRRLKDDFGLSAEDIAERTGKSRAAVVNFLRLLQLPSRVQEMVRSGKLSLGHARALLALWDCAPPMVVEFAKRAASLSVRETEKLIDEYINPQDPDPFVEPGRYLRPVLREPEKELRKALGAKVVIVENMGEGHIRVPFADEAELERVLARLMAPAKKQN